MQINPILDRSGPVPAFDKIEPGHFLPALDIIIDQAQTRIDALVQDDGADGFETLALALDAAFHDLTHIANVFSIYNLNKKSTDIAAIEAPLQSKRDAFSKQVFQNPVLAARFKTLYADGAHGKDGEDAYLLDVLNRKFLREGAYLDEAGKERLRAIDQGLINTATAFGENLRAAKLHHSVHVTDEAVLAGLDAGTIASLRDNARAQGKDGYVVVIERLLIDNLLGIAENRDFRKSLLQAVDAMGTVAPYDNRPLLQTFAQLRDERARLLGFPHFAAFALDGTMPGNVERAEEAIADMAPRALKLFSEELARIQDYARQNGGPDVLEPHDSTYWAQRYKNSFYAFDERVLSEYLPLDAVLKGYLDHTQRLFGLTFHENDQYPRFHDDVLVYDITDTQSGEPVGIIYIDLYARDEKRGGAWMEMIQNATDTHLPVVSININQLKPEAGKQALFCVEDVVTLFHEGGHGMHGLLGGNHHMMLQGVADGASTPEFKEIHSTMQEKWGRHTLSTYARHHQTGEKVPQSLLDAFERSMSFYESFAKVRLLQNALFDLTFHKTPAADYKGVEDTQARALLDHPGIMHARPYPLTRFGHLFEDAQSQYAAGYYGYFWADIYAAHGFAKFMQSGDIYDPALSGALKAFYMRGGALPSAAIYAGFAPEGANASAMMREIGLKDEPAAPKPPTLHA